ncbi:ImmA/IrrE family metallo-endopeptidase [Candidatus Avelusimicrobium sp.]|uniref:ImmA/IrrE family metallo-endopeptidase n=1 Tax=Candidatus Avelusimicrobium sp. TaxID=3048833 RepID=UPI003F7D6545
MAVIRRLNRQKAPTAPDLINTPEALLKYARSCGLLGDILDIEGIIKSFGINIIREPLQNDISGIFCQEDNGTYSIKVNSLQHPRRQRFTLAHELAHYCLHKHLKKAFEDKVLFRGGISSPEEKEANHFAGEILMPAEQFMHHVHSGNNSIQGLAEFFKVSSLAVRVRAKQLGLRGHGL